MTKRTRRKARTGEKTERTRRDIPLRGIPFGVIAVDPVGPAADQCFKFTLEDKKIKGTHIASIDGADDCVFLSSAACEDGAATYVICCKKGDDGKCNECIGKVTLQVADGDPTHPLVASKKVTVTCKHN